MVYLGDSEMMEDTRRGLVCEMDHKSKFIVDNQNIFPCYSNESSNSFNETFKIK
jgi:hypothetical protein